MSSLSRISCRQKNFVRRQGAVYAWMRTKTCASGAAMTILTGVTYRGSYPGCRTSSGIRNQHYGDAQNSWELRVISAGRRSRSSFWKNTRVCARIGWITRHLRVCTGVGRSYNAVKCKAEEIGRSLRLREGYTHSDLAKLFGTTESTVSKWFANRWLTANRLGRVTDGDIVDFIAQHPWEWHFKRVDETCLKGLLFTQPERHR